VSASHGLHYNFGTDRVRVCVPEISSGHIWQEVSVLTAICIILLPNEILETYRYNNRLF